MTEIRLPRVLLPVGHDLGAHFADKDSDPTFRVRVGEQMVEFDASEYVVWSLAHGSIGRGEEWSRADVAAAATARGLTDVESVIDRLIEWTMLYDIGLGTDESIDFSLVFRPVPLMLGLGTTIDDPDVFSVGLANEAFIQTTRPIYDLYVWAHLDENLWSACVASAALAAKDGASAPERTDPRLLMEYFLLGAHDFLAADGMYFDIARDRSGTHSPVMDIEGGAV
ncbi:hypothetical protein CLV47_108117 [Antricoccus suffuscus]|uniref:Uncharacterized protein n=1 Tax=Antricoccus suffuscus TaxID=1629062 RepID=A0A2T1A095_9ACTN|nr:hypothetical protein [Antricoccus suffuscus]PRZ41758.1 hypothetical protein CLV47_108117 [Antricoccus suffuscus]